MGVRCYWELSEELLGQPYCTNREMEPKVTGWWKDRAEDLVTGRRFLAQRIFLSERTCSHKAARKTTAHERACLLGKLGTGLRR